jgi:uncharacterized membrane protein YdjX (TVP38/TMEM64 family)
MKSAYYKVAIGIAVLAVLILVVRESGVRELLDIESARATILGYGALAPLLYVLFYILASLIFIPGTPLTLLGGAIFGPLYGTIYTIVGASLGAMSAFLIMRFIGGGILKNGSGDIAKRLAEYDEKLKNHGLATVLFLRLAPLFPFNGLNFALGLTSVRFRDYALGTFLGIMPGTFTLVYFGDSLASFSLPKIIGGVVLLILLALVGRYLIKRFK